MKKLIGSLLMVALAVTGCGVKTEADVRSGMPSSDSVKVNAPSSGNHLLGATAEFYLVTYGATAVVNVGVVSVLALVDLIVQQPSTSHTGNTFVWGPSTPTGLEPNSWKLTVTANDDDTYTYKLEGKKKDAPDSSFVTVLSGNHKPAQLNGQNDPKHGSGSFLLDWNARATLNAPDGNVGTANVTYSNLDDNAQVDVTFTGINTSQGAGSTALYHYKQPKGADGLFQFSTTAAATDATDANGQFTIESRWQTDGSGRSDVQASGGSLGTVTAKVSQCWDSNFAETYYGDTLSNGGHIKADEGSASACSITTAEFYSGN
jgi:hypothetical protein